MIAAVLGTGLIGASVGLALRQQGWATHGWDPDAANLAAAGSIGAIEVAADTVAECVAGVDLVVVATPPGAAAGLLAELRTEALVTDVAGVKREVVSAGSHIERFVSSHPMAGREVSGPRAADPHLFRGATWVLITDGAKRSALEELRGIVASVGANPVEMTAAEHDDAVATISHLPQILAAALAAHAAEHPIALGLAAGGFRDLTRVASSGPEMWTGLLTANRADVAAALRNYRERLEGWEAAIATGDDTTIGEWLDTAREIRERMAAPVAAVHVGLADRPGEIASVGRAIGAGGVDIRDLQLRHAPHGGGGILTISVTPDAVTTLRDALEEEGLLVID